MTEATPFAATPADVPAAPSIFGILFKQKQTTESPQEDDDQIAVEEKDADPQAIKQPIVLADLRLLQQLTRQLQVAIMSTSRFKHNEDAAQSMSLKAERNNLATLYCRRSAALLAFVDYDATTSVPLDVLALEPSASILSKETNQSAPMLEAVRQALQDAQAAAALTSNNATLAEAHLLSAYCSRSLGELSHARAFTALATTALPDSAPISSLAEQLDVEARSDVADRVPQLRMTSATLATLATATARADSDFHQEDGDNNDQPEQIVSKMPLSTNIVEQSRFWSQVGTHFQVLEAAAYSAWLDKLERLLHHNVHHRCALPNEARQLDCALQATLALLARLLQSKAACLALNLDMTDDAAARTVEKLTQAAVSSTQIVVQNRVARKWIVQVWAPAVRRVMASANRSPLIDLSSDVLMMLSRVLNASGNFRQCISMAHSLAYAEMGYDLAKVSCDVGDHLPTRLEMQGAEAYATALLHRATDYEKALMTFQETLQAALATGDQEYEVRSRFHVAKTQRLMGKFEIAHAELVLLLERSRILNDVHMEAIAEYEMGQHFVQLDDMETAIEHFRAAQALCNRTANCADSWRATSIQQAIAFFARSRPTVRRGAIRCSVSSLVLPVNNEENEDIESGNKEDVEIDKREEERPKERRPAICYKESLIQPQSLISTLINKTVSDCLCGPKPKRTMSWRETVYTTK